MKKFLCFVGFLGVLVLGWANFAFAVHVKGPNEFVISETDDSEGGISAAYGSGNFIAGWTHKIIPSGSKTTRAQLISPEGTLIGSQIVINESNGWPIVASNGTDFLLLYSYGYGNNNVDYVGRGQIISGSGSLVGSIFDIGSHDAVVSDGTNYLVGWKNDTNGGIYGQIISPSGAKIGSEIAISVGPDAKRKKPDFSFGCYGAGKYLVVWTDNQRIGSCTGAIDVKGRFILPNGTLQGGEFTIDQNDYASDNPISVAYDGTNFLVAFPDQVGGSPDGEWDLFARFVSPTGTVGTRFTISSEPGNQLLPGVIWDGSKYLIVWNEGSPLSTATVHKRYFDASGAPVSSDEIIAQGLSGKTVLVGPIVAGSSKILAVVVRMGAGDFDSDDADMYGLFIGEPQVTGSLTITSTPSGAKIYLDSNDTGSVTNRTFTNISAGTHTIKLTLSGYQDWYGTGTVISGLTTYVYATLIPTGPPIVGSITAQTFFGGPNNEYPLGIAVRGSDLYAVGRKIATDDNPALLLKYALPVTSGATPIWTKTFESPIKVSGWGEYFAGVSVTENGVYTAGCGGQYTDSVGDQEGKTARHKYTSGGDLLWYYYKTYYPYSGCESFQDVLALQEDGVDVIYTTGHAPSKVGITIGSFFPNGTPMAPNRLSGLVDMRTFPNFLRHMMVPAWVIG